jgi:hypothetical protein
MMMEFDNLSQQEGGYRRLFTDEDFELYVWYEREGGPFKGFQLVYDRQTDPHALTWLEDEGFGHNAIDDGELSSYTQKATPVLMPDGLFDKERVAPRFERASEGIDGLARSYVLSKLEIFDNRAINPFI